MTHPTRTIHCACGIVIGIRTGDRFTAHGLRLVIDPRQGLRIECVACDAVTKLKVVKKKMVEVK